MDKKLSNLDCDETQKRKRKQPNRRVKRENGNNNADNDDEDGKRTTRKKRGRWDVSQYCWSCGAGNHGSGTCTKKKPGHKNNATFRNMMGGCTDFCQIIPE